MNDIKIGQSLERRLMKDCVISNDYYFGSLSREVINMKEMIIKVDCESAPRSYISYKKVKGKLKIRRSSRIFVS